ncbi:hypothetical protein Avbf_11356 [Armadillidium vulgare]|nr:hypothetical protein Avbf_11356 [Armadillidium vulgare]
MWSPSDFLSPGFNYGLLLVDLKLQREVYLHPLVTIDMLTYLEGDYLLAKEEHPVPVNPPGIPMEQHRIRSQLSETTTEMKIDLIPQVRLSGNVYKPPDLVCPIDQEDTDKSRSVIEPNSNKSWFWLCAIVCANWFIYGYVKSVIWFPFQPNTQNERYCIDELLQFFYTFILPNLNMYLKTSPFWIGSNGILYTTVEQMNPLISLGNFSRLTLGILNCNKTALVEMSNIL